MSLAAELKDLAAGFATGYKLARPTNADVAMERLRQDRADKASTVGAATDEGIPDPSRFRNPAAPGGSPTPSLAGAPVPSGDPADPTAWRPVIKSQESGSPEGRYGIAHKETPSGDRAYGAYGIMGKNIPAWTMEALGRAMSPADFVKDPVAQDKVFDYKFGSYLQKYGPEGAANAWYTGSPTKRAYDPTSKQWSNQYVTSVMDKARKMGLELGEGPYTSPLASTMPTSAPLPPRRQGTWGESDIATPVLPDVTPDAGPAIPAVAVPPIVPDRESVRPYRSASGVSTPYTSALPTTMEGAPRPVRNIDIAAGGMGYTPPSFRNPGAVGVPSQTQGVQLIPASMGQRPPPPPRSWPGRMADPRLTDTTRLGRMLDSQGRYYDPRMDFYDPRMEFPPTYMAVPAYAEGGLAGNYNWAEQAHPRGLLTVPPAVANTPAPAAVETSRFAAPPAMAPAAGQGLLTPTGTAYFGPQTGGPAQMPFQALPLNNVGQWNGSWGRMHFAQGGAVPDSEGGPAVSEDPTAYETPEDQTTVWDGALNMIAAGGKGLAKMVSSPAALPDADPRQAGRERALLTGEGGASPAEIEELKARVDPEKRYREDFRLAKGYAALYDLYNKRGDIQQAQLAGAKLLIHAKAAAQQYGALAAAAAGQGDYNQAANYLAQAKNQIPDGETYKVIPGADGAMPKFQLIDDRTGKYTKEGELSVNTIMQSINGVRDGSAWLDIITGATHRRTGAQIKEEATAKDQAAAEAFQATLGRDDLVGYRETLGDDQLKLFNKMSLPRQKQAVAEWQRAQKDDFDAFKFAAREGQFADRLQWSKDKFFIDLGEKNRRFEVRLGSGDDHFEIRRADTKERWQQLNDRAAQTQLTRAALASGKLSKAQVQKLSPAEAIQARSDAAAGTIEEEATKQKAALAGALPETPMAPEESAQFKQAAQGVDLTGLGKTFKARTTTVPLDEGALGDIRTKFEEQWKARGNKTPLTYAQTNSLSDIAADINRANPDIGQDRAVEMVLSAGTKVGQQPLVVRAPNGGFAVKFSDNYPPVVMRPESMAMLGAIVAGRKGDDAPAPATKPKSAIAVPGMSGNPYDVIRDERGELLTPARRQGAAAAAVRSAAAQRQQALDVETSQTREASGKEFFMAELQKLGMWQPGMERLSAYQLRQEWRRASQGAYQQRNQLGVR